MKDNRVLYALQYRGCFALLCLALMVSLTGCKREPEELVFELDEVSAFEVPKELHWDFVSGQAADCNERPDPNVKKYPAFKSDKPLYGSIQLPREFQRKASGPMYHFAIDESAGTGRGYDRLYFDLNRDLDLTNDVPRSTQDNPPKGAILGSSRYKPQICFNCIDIPFDFGSEGHQPLELLPRLVMRKDEDPLLTFVTTKARKGKIEIAGHKYDVWLGHNRRVSGSFDRPSTALHLIPDGDLSRLTERDPMWLMFVRKIGRIHYYFSATPSGDRLIVQPYQGKYGTFKVGSGNRDFRKMKMSGYIWSGTEGMIDTIVPVGGKPNRWGELKAVHSCKVPVGDYSPGLEVYLDRLHLSISRNIHSDGKRSGKLEGPYKFGIKIREDQPFVLDFSSKPEVLFAAPARDYRIKLGEQLINVEAVLTDPKLDVMIGDLERANLGYEVPDLLDDDYLPFLIAFTAGLVVAGFSWILSILIRSKRRFFLTSAGLFIALTIGAAIVCYVASLELDYQNISPVVTIARSDGEIVARGVMPFG